MLAGLHAIARAGGVRGKRVLVSGAGPIGLLAAGAAVALGAESVAVADLLERPLEVARRLGAAATVDLRAGGVAAESFDMRMGVKIQAAISATPTAAPMTNRPGKREGRCLDRSISSMSSLRIIASSPPRRENSRVTAT